MSEDKKITEEEADQMRKDYYDSANTVGRIFSDSLVMSSQVAHYAGSPHYRAMVGGGIIGTALMDLHKHSADDAKQVFQELVAGLLNLGERLGLSEEANDDAA